ncbi:MAG: hypothetical protein P8H35_08595 [Flavobacteriales bacterium]|nr:hypothetical protein [Flavobacteriales bacterium]
MRLIIIVIIYSISFQTFFSQVTYEADETGKVTNKPKLIKQKVSKEEKIKDKKNISFGVTLGVKYCVSTIYNPFFKWGIYPPASKKLADEIANSYGQTYADNYMRPQPIFNLSNIYFTTSIKLNDKSNLYINLGLKRHNIKISNVSDTVNSFLSDYTVFGEPNGSGILNGSDVNMKINVITLPIIYSYKLNKKINIELGVSLDYNLWSKNNWTIANDRVVDGYSRPWGSYSVMEFKYTDMIFDFRASSSLCYNFNLKNQIRLLIDTRVLTFRDDLGGDLRIYVDGEQLLNQNTISRFTFLHLNYTYFFKSK